MRRFLKSNIKRKVLLVAVFPAATVTLLLTLVTSISQTRGLEQSLSERGFAIVRQLAPASEYGVYSANQDILQPLVESVMNEADVNSVIIRNSQGQVLIKSGPDMRAASEVNFTVAVPTIFKLNDSKSWIFQAPIYQTEFYAVEFLEDDLNNNISNRSKIRVTDKIIGWVSIELSLKDLHAYQTKTWMNMGIIALVTLLLSAVLAIRMGRTITNPIMTLKAAVNELEEGNFDVNVDTGVKGELKSLESGINNMARALKASRSNLEERVSQATLELRKTLSVLEQKNTELDSARSEAESANKAKSAFMANISHEIRTPLNGIHGFLMLLSNTNLNEYQKEYIDKIDVSTKTLLTLLNDVLDFSKLEVAKLNIELTEFDLRELLDECICIFTADAQNKGLELILIVDADVPDHLCGGADRISQIVNNLVSNAVKFTSVGEVVVHAEKVEISGNDITVRISVTDTGIGISSDDRERLFQPFSQLEVGRNKSYSGTGLGLVISKSLVELMKGNVFVDSIPDIGSRFSFQLPLKKCDLSGKDMINTKILHGDKVLIVSPVSHINHSFQNMLMYWGIKAEAISDAATAISMIRSSTESVNHFRVIIIDGMLAVYDVSEIMDAIDDCASESKLHAVLLDRTDNYKRTDPGLRQRFSGTLSRPPRTKEVIQLLSRILSGNNDLIEGVAEQVNGSNIIVSHAMSLRILIADDNVINRQFLSTWLKQVGVQVDEVADGSEAIVRCQNIKYDLILMDLHMPKVDGLQAATKIHEMENGVKTPIIAITADATDDAKNLVKESGIDDYLIKPVDGNELLDVLNKWCPQPEESTLFSGEVDANNNHDIKLVQTDIVDQSSGMRYASGNKELWYWSLQTLAERLPQQLDEMRQVLKCNDTQQLAKHVHSIIGAASYCGANGMLVAATQLQQALHQIDEDSILSGFDQLCIAVSDFTNWVEERV